MGQVLSFNSVYFFYYTKYNNDKTQQSYSIFFSFLFNLVNRPSHETIKRKIFRSTNSGPLQMMHHGPTTELTPTASSRFYYFWRACWPHNNQNNNNNSIMARSLNETIKP